MKSKKGKWYAIYDGVASYEILFYKQRDEEMEMAEDLGDMDRLATLRDMVEFNTFTDAKKYIIMHLKGDIDDLSMVLKGLRGTRKPKV